MATGFILSRLVYTAASLGIADHLASSPKSASQLAGPTGCDAVSLARFMRTLTNFGILALGDDDRFSLTALGEPLRSDVPGSVRSGILTMAGQWSWQTWEEFPSTVETGKPAFDTVFGMPVFDWLAQHPDEATRFSETMVAVHGAEPPAVAAAYDFSPCGVIVDVGGASGNLLGHVLAKHPRPKGCALRPPAGHDGRTSAATGARRRGPCNDSGGQRVRGRAAGGGRLPPLARHSRLERGPLPHHPPQLSGRDDPTSRLLIIELVLREGNAPGFGSADMVMMTLTGGAERTAGSFNRCSHEPV
jgi:hypothetical protein